MIFKLNEKLNKNNLDIEIGDIVEFDQGYIFDKNGNDITEHRFVVVDWDELVPENVFVLMISSGTKNPAKFKYIIDRNGNMTQTTKKAYQYNENIFNGDVDDDTKGYVKCDMKKSVNIDTTIIKHGKATESAIRKWLSSYEDAKANNRLDESIFIRLNESQTIDNDFEYTYTDYVDGIVITFGLYSECEEGLDCKVIISIDGQDKSLWYWCLQNLENNTLELFAFSDDMVIINLDNYDLYEFNNKDGLSKDIFVDIAKSFNKMLSEIDVNKFLEN